MDEVRIENLVEFTLHACHDCTGAKTSNLEPFSQAQSALFASNLPGLSHVGTNRSSCVPMICDITAHHSLKSPLCSSVSITLPLHRKWTTHLRFQQGSDKQN